MLLKKTKILDMLVLTSTNLRHLYFIYFKLVTNQIKDGLLIFVFRDYT